MEKTPVPSTPPVSAVPKDEVVEDFKQAERKTRGCGFCAVSFLIAFVLGVGLLLWVIASTGFAQIPVVSSFAYKAPEPVRVVKPGVPLEQLAQSTFTSILTQRLKEAGGQLTNRSVTLQIPEASITASLQNALRTSSSNFIDVDHAQIAVLPNEQLELFVPLKTQDRLTALRARVSLVAEQGIFDLTLSDVKIGTFSVPGALIASSIQPFVNRELGAFNQALSTYMHVDSLKTQNGTLAASGTFTVQIQK